MYNQKYHQFDTFYNHKFGFHISGPRQDAFDAVFRVKPKVVKTLDFSVEVMKKIRKEIPDVFLIGRLFVFPQDFGQLSGGKPRHAKQKGLEMAEKILREEVNRDIHHIDGQPIFHAWESLNEVFPEWTDPDTQKLYDEYQIAFGEKMLSEGFEPIAFNLGQGNGRGQQWLDLYPGTLETYKYLGFHEYDWPAMDRLHRIGLEGPDEPHNLVPGAGEGRGNDGMWRCLRYRRIMNEGIRQKYGHKHVCIITECGMTQGVWGGTAEDIGPWAEQLTVPPDIPGGVVSTPIPVDDYWQSLLWYNSELIKDDYVMGACLFVTGAAGMAEWETFEHLGPIMERIEKFQEEISLEPTASTPLPPADSGPIEVRTTPATATVSPPAPDFQAPAVEIEADTAAEAETTSPTVEVEADTATEVETTVPSIEIEASVSAEAETTIPTVEIEISTSPEAETTAPPAESEWQLEIERGAGLPLLVGNIGLAGEQVSITKPNDQVERVTSGSKPEHGGGGFEIYAYEHGPYKVEFLDQSFDISMSGQFTKVTFTKPT